MKKSIILYTSMLINIAATQEFVGHCPPASADDKQALIAELLCVENHNKELILRRNQYDSLLRIIRQQDGSDCLGIRCINANELSIKVDTNPEKTQLKVDFGDGNTTTLTGGQSTATDFTGIIGTMPNDTLTDTCHSTSNSMSFIKVISNQGKKVTITSIELKLRYPNDTYKTVFFTDELNTTLSRNEDLRITKDDILSNPAFLTASAGSCHD